MVIMGIQFKFVNRKKELNYIKTKCQESFDAAQVLVVSSPSGYGKSELLAHCMVDINSMPTYKVEINNPGGQVYDDGYALREIGKSISASADKYDQLLSVNDYLLELGSNVQIEWLFKELKDEIAKQLDIKDMDSIFDSWKNKNWIISNNLIFDSDNGEILLAVQSYIQEQLKTGPFLLNIENIQCVDYYSLNFLSSIINSCTSGLFVFEFTLNTEGITLRKIIDQFNTSANVEVFKLAPLSVNDVQEILESEPELTLELVNRSFTAWQGNLRPLTDLFYTIKFGASVNYENKTFSHLLSLEKVDRYLLSAIYVHREPVDYDLLKQHIEGSAFEVLIWDFDDRISHLIDRKLIKILNGSYALKHDYIGAVINEEDVFRQNNVIAKKRWFEVYQSDDIDKNIFLSKSIILQRRLYFCTILNNKSNILTLLDDIRVETVRNRNPERLLNYVKELWDELRAGSTEKSNEIIAFLEQWLLTIYVELGLFNTADNILRGTHLSGKSLDILKGIIYEQTGRHNEAVSFCDKILSMTNKRDNYHFALRLIRMVSWFGMGLENQCKKEFLILEGNDQHKKYFEYGFLLRNAELVFSYRESIPYFKRSIDFFETYKATRQTGLSRLTLAIHLALLGQFDEAELQIKIATRELSGLIGDRHLVFNNNAILKLMKGEISTEVIKLLTQAYLTADVDFDKVTILSNLIAVKDLKRDLKDIDEIINKLIRLLKEPRFSSQEIIGYAYFNLYRYYESVDGVLAGEYFNQLISLGIHEDKLWNYWLFNKPITQDHDQYYRAQVGRAVSFLSNWNMDFRSDLMSY